MDASATIDELTRANTAQAHRLRVEHAAVHILAKMVEGVDMDALYTMAELRVRQEDERACVGQPALGRGAA